MTGLERRLTIALPSEHFEDQITSRLEDARSQVRIPGFRPGKVPLKEVRRRYGNAVRAEVAGELMQSSFVEAIQQEDLSPAGSPNLEVVKMDPGIDFEFTATFEVFPAITLTALSEVSVRQPSAEITDEDLETMIDRLQEQRTTFETVERACEEGDQVNVDFSGKLDGELFDGGTGEGVDFVVGAGQMIEDFDQGVRGLSAGEETSFEATFPEDYQADNLKGQTVTFEVTVNEVKEAARPELDDEFFEAFGVSEGGEEAFRTEVRSNMERELGSAKKNQIKQQVMDELSRIHEFQIPGAMVQREIQVLKDQMLSQFQMPAQAKAPDLPDELFHDQAEKRVKIGLVVNEIITSESLEADAERVEERLNEMAAPYGEPEQVINWYRSNPEQMQSIEMGVLEDQVVDLIMSKAAVEDVSLSYEEVLNGKLMADLQAEMAESESSDADEDAETTQAQAEDEPQQTEEDKS